MSSVQFKTYRTSELAPEKLRSLTKNFNAVFEKELPVSFFEQQYNVTVKGYSFHSFMEKDGEVVGACSAVPYEYSYNGQTKIFGLIVGLFILKEHRKDPFALYKMYSGLKKEMIEAGICFAMAVPNRNSYPYFKQVLKWKDIGNLSYYALPVKYGNMKSGNKMLNAFSWLFAHSLSTANRSKNIFINHAEKLPGIFIVPDGLLMEDHRYNEAHRKVKQKNFAAFYRADKEDGIQAVYLIDFYNAAGKKDSKSLERSISYILTHEKPDIILYIGSLHFPQFSLIKVPENKEPKKLNFCGEILIKEEIGEDVFEKSNWDFGLYNFDVR